MRPQRPGLFHNILQRGLLGAALLTVGCDNDVDSEISSGTGSTSDHNTTGSGTNATSDSGGTSSTTAVQAGMDSCVPHVTSFADLGAVTPAGISGQAVLDRAKGVHSVLLKAAKQRQMLTVVPEGMGQTGEIEITYTGKPIRHVRSEFTPCMAEICNDIWVMCFDSVEVDVNVKMRSSDGALQESWDTTLTAWDPNDPDLAIKGESPEDVAVQAELSQRLGTLSFAGTVKVEPVVLNGWTLERAEATLHARFAAGKLEEAHLTGEVYSKKGSDEAGVAAIATEAIYEFEPADGGGRSSLKY